VLSVGVGGGGYGGGWELDATEFNGSGIGGTGWRGGPEGTGEEKPTFGL
jgi:hypothetical protein